MFQNKSILAIIAARGGSKGVPGKNIKLAGGKPLIGWIIETAKKSTYIDRLILSSDDPDIIQAAKAFECEVPWVRPKELARDKSSVNDVIVHALNHVSGYDYVLLLQPTSPLTRFHDIDGCIENAIFNKYQSIVSVSEAPKNPYWMFNLQHQQLIPFLDKKYLNCRRQDLPKAYVPTGAFYLAEAGWFLQNKSFYSNETQGYIVPHEYSIDIDSPLDFKIFEALTADDDQL